MRTRETITQDASRARWKNDYTRLAWSIEIFSSNINNFPIFLQYTRAILGWPLGSKAAFPDQCPVGLPTQWQSVMAEA